MHVVHRVHRRGFSCDVRREDKEGLDGCRQLGAQGPIVGPTRGLRRACWVDCVKLEVLLEVERNSFPF